MSFRAPHVLKGIIKSRNDLKKEFCSGGRCRCRCRAQRAVSVTQTDFALVEEETINWKSMKLASIASQSLIQLLSLVNLLDEKVFKCIREFPPQPRFKITILGDTILLAFHFSMPRDVAQLICPVATCLAKSLIRCCHSVHRRAHCLR
jgi:hypothetical protein